MKLIRLSPLSPKTICYEAATLKNSIPPLRLAPRRSLWLVGLLLVAHAGAFALVFLIPAPAWIRVLLACLISISLIAALNTHALLRSRRAIVHAVWDSDNQWTLRNAAGDEFDARLLSGSYVNSALVILNFSAGKRWLYRSLVLMPDSLDADTFRQLRVRLLHPPVPGAHNSVE